MRRLFSAAAIAGTLLACTSNNTGTTDTQADSGPSVNCQTDSRVDTYVANLEKKSQGGAFTTTLVAADPAPPIKGTNTWTLKVVDATGQPMTTGVAIATFMPDHGHTATVTPTITAQPDGTWKAENLYFFMPGVWRITITSGKDSAQYFFCVAG
jgi:hypothetical protein